MKRRGLLALLLIFAVLMSGCGAQADAGNSSDAGLSAEESAVGSDAAEEAAASVVSASDLFSDQDFETDYDESASAVIQLNGDSASCGSNAVEISGSTVTITDKGTYILSGTLDDGMIVVNAGKTDKVQLVLNGVDIHSETCAPVYILQADKVFITLAADTTNTLTNGGTFTAIDENNIDAVVFSKEDLTLNGSGTLVITSPAGHGIVSKDSLRITGGSYDINCASHGLSGKDEICIANAEFTIVSGKDGIQAENEDDTALGYIYIQSGTFDISAEGDGISASCYLQIEDGSFRITAGGAGDAAVTGSGTTDETSDSTSMKGLKAETDLIINGGDFCINSADDAVHSNGSVTVAGGSFEIASGDDAFHAEETLAVTAGSINITESYEGLEGLYVNISGGDITIVASDDGVNAAGGTDASGTTGGRDSMFGGPESSSSGGAITISGGTISITAYGDGIDSNGTLEITGGCITVAGPAQGDSATLDYDASATITGGTFIGTGASGMAQTFSSSGQGVISVSVGSQSAGCEITLTDSSGNTVISYIPELDFSVVILSSPEIITGETYTITVGSASGEFTAS